MPSYRLRVQVRDVPGALAELTASLASAGVDVLRVDVHGVDGHVAVDELSVVTPETVREGALRLLVHRAHAEALVVAPLAVDRDTDPVTRSLQLARRLIGADDAFGAADRILTDLLDTPAWVLPQPAEGHPLFGREGVGSPTVLTIPTPGGRDRDAVASVALVPSSGLLGVAIRWGRLGHTASELARAASLLDLVAASTSTRTPAPAPLPTLVPLRSGDDVGLRPLCAADAVHLLDLDLRLSDRSRRLRYLSARGLPTGTELRMGAADPSRDGIALGAWDGQGLVGSAQLVRLADDPVSGEFAIVVADDHHRRGVGTALLRELVAQARQRGIRRLVAHVSAENRGIRGLVRREVPMSILRIAHGQAEIVIDLRDTPSFA